MDRGLNILRALDLKLDKNMCGVCRQPGNFELMVKQGAWQLYQRCTVLARLVCCKTSDQCASFLF